MIMISVGVLGSTGHMGRAILTALEAHPRCRLSIAGTRLNTAEVFQSSDVVIDFTTPDTLISHADFSHHFRKPLVIGTTGLTAEHDARLHQIATTVPLVVSPNMSIAVTLLANLVRQAAEILDESYDIEISELHHRHKKDAPSGTALMLGKAVSHGKGKPLAALCSPDDRQGPRPSGVIGFSSQRGGAVVGDHMVRFIGDEDMIELSHRGFSKNLYAKGALRAAEWVVTQKPGFYSMADVLEL
jgi:4-hydroxy-tetrahydrodipicolinate reductase